MDPSDYSSCAQGKLLELRETDRNSYRGNEHLKLQVGQEVLLNNPTKGKLDPRWTGPWIVREWKGPPNVKIRMNNKERVIHVNRERPLLKPDLRVGCSEEQWSPPLFQYCDESPAPATRDKPPAPPQSGRPVTTRILEAEEL